MLVLVIACLLYLMDFANSAQLDQLTALERLRFLENLKKKGFFVSEQTLQRTREKAIEDEVVASSKIAKQVEETYQVKQQFRQHAELLKDQIQLQQNLQLQQLISEQQANNRDQQKQYTNNPVALPEMSQSQKDLILQHHRAIQEAVLQQKQRAQAEQRSNEEQQQQRLAMQESLQQQQYRQQQIQFQQLQNRAVQQQQQQREQQKQQEQPEEQQLKQDLSALSGLKLELGFDSSQPPSQDSQAHQFMVAKWAESRLSELANQQNRLNDIQHTPGASRAPTASLSPEKALEKAAQLKKYRAIVAKELQQKVEQRKQKMFSIPSRKRVVVGLSPQRSGSTLMLSLFSLIENAFVLPEPHNMWDVNVTLPRFMSKTAALPTVKSLLDCSFINKDGVKNVFWKYACDHAQWILQDPNKLRECLTGRLSLSMLQQKCQNADLNLVKIVRLPFLVRHFGRELIPKNVKVYNLVRAPWSVFMSQYKAGWFIDSQMPLMGMVPKGADPNTFHMDRICNQLLLNDEVARDRPKENYLLIRYEDVLSQFEESVSALFHFMNIPATEELLNAAKAVSSRKYADFLGLPPSMVNLTIDDAKQISQSLDSCRRVMIAFDYKIDL